MTTENSKLIERKQEYLQQLECIRHEEDGDELERQFKKLEDIMEEMFATDMEQRQGELEQQAAKQEELSESYESRKTQRETIIKAKLQQVRDDAGNKARQTGSKTSASEASAEEGDELFAFGNMRIACPRFQVVWDKTEDGQRRMKIFATLLRPETRSREVEVSVEVEQTLSRVIDGKEIESTVLVPVQRVIKETYEVRVPVFRVLEIDVPKGEDWYEVALIQTRSASK